MARSVTMWNTPQPKDSTSIQNTDRQSASQSPYSHSSPQYLNEQASNYWHPRTQHAVNQSSLVDVPHSSIRRSAPQPSASGHVTGSLSRSRHPLVLRKSYHQRPKRFFKAGRVFYVILAEKAGTSPRTSDEKFITDDVFGRKLISKPRPCIVVEQHGDYCNVVPITSYGDRGIGKPSVEPSEHCIVYTDQTQVTFSSQELERTPCMLQEPVRVVPDDKNDAKCRLFAGSFIDFGKLYCVHHYHEVDNLGLVTGDSLSILLQHNYTVRSRARGVAPSIPLPIEHMREVFEPNTGPSSGTIMDATTPLASVMQVASLQSLALREKQKDPIHKYISNDSGCEDERDSSYAIRARRFFAWGTVFRLLSWSEAPVDEQSEITDVVHGKDAQGAPILRKVMWLVVIQEPQVGEDSCKCLRISTYEGRGVSNLPKGLSRSDHSVIYTGRAKPPIIPAEMPEQLGEKEMGLALRVKEFDREEKMFPTARINWTKVYDVKLDVKANLFGHVARRCDYVLEHQFKDLNPTSPIDSSRPSRKSSWGESDYPRNEALNTYMLAKECDESSSSYTSSKETEEAEPKHDSRHTFNTGDDVFLLAGEDNPGLFPVFKQFRVHAARMAVDDQDGSVVWEYNLKYPEHEGKFFGGTYFQEKFLMPAAQHDRIERDI